MDIPPQNIKKSVSIRAELKALIARLTKTRRRKIILVISGVILFSLLIGAGILISKLNSSQTEIKVAKNLASDKVFDNYDYIYNSGDNKIIVSTLDRTKQLELISGEDKIIDYIISSDKKKITYSVSVKDYKKRITSENIPDLTTLKIDPVPFKVYELNLETGENKLILTIDKIQLGKTQQQVYKWKQIIHPDSYAVNYGWDGTPYSYPVSYITYEDDIAGGYTFDYLPWDLRPELAKKQIKLISYSPDSQKFAYSIEDKIIIYNLKDNTKKETAVTVSPYNDCYYKSGVWEYNILNLQSYCYYGGGGGVGYIEPRTAYKVDNDMLSLLFDKNIYSGTSYMATTSEYALVSSKANFGGEYRMELESTELSKYDFKKNTLVKVGELGKDEYIFSIESIGSPDPVFASRRHSVDDSKGNNTYTFYRFNSATNSIEKLDEFTLPSDIYGISYNLDQKRLTYYRKYQASNESIIEYKIVDTNTKEEKELLTIKISNDSVLYYNPRLVWFDKE